MRKLASWQADLLLLGVALVWGTTFVLIKNALMGITPFLFNALRFGVAFLFLYLLYRPGKKLLNPQLLRIGLIIGFVLFGGYATQTVGLQYTSAANSAFITGLQVVIVPFLNIFFTRRFPNLTIICSAVCAVVGLGFLTLTDGLSIRIGDFLTFLCAVFFGLHIVLVSRFATRYNSNLLTIIQIGTVAVFSILVFLGHPTEYWPTNFTGDFWLALAVTAIPGTSLAILIINRVQKYATATRTAIMLAMEPVFGALTAWTIGGELLTLRSIIGSALVLLGILIVEIRGEHQDQE